jgi:hypothetical protein
MSGTTGGMLGLKINSSEACTALAAGTQELKGHPTAGHRLCVVLSNGLFSKVGVTARPTAMLVLRPIALTLKNRPCYPHRQESGRASNAWQPLDDYPDAREL